jgi:hypothetical protein
MGLAISAAQRQEHALGFSISMHPLCSPSSRHIEVSVCIGESKENSAKYAASVSFLHMSAPREGEEVEISQSNQFGFLKRMGRSE